MTAPLNYTTKALIALATSPFPDWPLSRAGVAYLADKLRQAEVFVLPGHGELLDRSKPRPEVPASTLKPPFPVVACEYTADVKEWGHEHYDAARCSKRIALAWEWTNDLPKGTWSPDGLGEGVVVASIGYYDQIGRWLPVGGAIHLAYDAPWEAPPETPFRAALMDAGRMSPAIAQAKTLRGGIIGLLPEMMAGAAAHGGVPMVIDALHADLMDEVNAYTDLCQALAFGGFRARKVPAAAALNKQRIRAGKLAFKDYHVLEAIGGAA